MNPEKRGIFKNGVALQGSLIHGIEPDYHATMGWNETHILDSDDWNQLNSKGIAKEMNLLLSKAKDVVREYQNNPEIFALPLSKIEIKKLESGIDTKVLLDKLRN
jgi:hypothetical protein